MKKILYAAVLGLSSLSAFAQGEKHTIDVLGHSISSNNYYDIVKELDDYWANQPSKNNKGSGFKPYVRWKTLWQYYLNTDSSLMSASQIAAQYKRTQKLTSRKYAKTTGVDLSYWEPLGPYNHTNKGSWSSGQGRVNVSLVDPSDTNTIYIGSPNGGLWRSADAGNSWMPLTDFLPSIGISGIAVDPSNAKVIYISTGDEDGSNAYTDGIYKSIDSGLTWTQLSYPYLPGSYSGELYINPFSTQMIWVAGRNGLYKSIDGGLNWLQKTTQWCKEIRQKPNDSSTLYLVEKVGATTNILKSTDAGETFSTIQTYATTSRAVIDVTPADPDYLYVLVANADNTFKGIYRSTDAGASFTTQNDTTNVFSYGSASSLQAYYDLAIAVSDTDPNIIYTGCMDIWKSTNGGGTIYKINRWNKPDTATYTHADIHDIKFFNHKIYVASDGGIYVSSDDAASFSDKTVNGLNISQFYRIDVAQSDSTQVVGGLQDNGGYSYANNAWVNFHGADGMDAAIDPTNINLHYGFIQYGGSMYKIDIGSITDTGKLITQKPASESGNWITPLEFGNGGTLYAGYSKLYYLKDTSFELAATRFFNPKITQIRVHPSNDSIVMVSNGIRLYITDGSPLFNFTQFSSLTLSPISNFDFNRNNPDIIYAIGDSGVYKTKDKGISWENITYNLPDGAKNAIIHQASSTNNTVYLAMNKAVYYIDDGLSEWQLYSNNIPNTTITDIEVNNVENHVVISTYGRGIWRSPVVISSLGIDQKVLDKPVASVFPNPVLHHAYLNTTITEPCVIKVFDSKGALLLSQSYRSISPNTEFDFSALSTGVYIFNLRSEKHLITKKFIKE